MPPVGPEKRIIPKPIRAFAAGWLNHSFDAGFVLDVGVIRTGAIKRSRSIYWLPFPLIVCFAF